MYEAIQSASARVPVVLETTAGTAVTGITGAQITVAVSKSDGTATTVVPTSFTEVTTGAFSGSGFYWMQLPGSAFSLVGPLVYVVLSNTAAFKTYRGAIKVTTGDTTTIYGQNVTEAAAIANIQADTDDIQSRLTTQNTKIDIIDQNVDDIEAAPAGLDIDLTNIDNKIDSVQVDTNDIQNRLTVIQADTDDIQVKIAAVQADTDDIQATLAALDFTGLEAALEDLIKLQTGKWQIHVTGPDANRMVIYEEDGVTPLAKFDLFTANGQPTAVNPYIRVPVP